MLDSLLGVRGLSHVKVSWTPLILHINKVSLAYMYLDC